MKKQIFLTGMLAFTLLTPVSDAKAQGYPTFDVAKLASLITNLIGRFQPVPQVLSRVNQVKSTIAQVQAVGQAALSGDLKALGKAAAAGLQTDAFSGGNIRAAFENVAKGDNGASDSSKKIKESLFSLQKGKVLSTEDQKAIADARKEYQKNTASEVLAKALYMTMNAPRMSEERFKKADEAMKNAETIQDSVNANTLMLMAGNFERLNQIAIDLASLKSMMIAKINKMPVSGYKKPEPLKGVTLGEGTFSDEEKDEADVNF